MSSFAEAQKTVSIHQFLSVLFNRNEATCFSKTPRGITIHGLDHDLIRRSQSEAFFSINPMDSTKTRADAAVVVYRNTLVEMDKLTLNEQEAHIMQIGMPYSTAVYSGGKSIHYIISLETPIVTEKEYRILVNRIYSAVGNTYVDKANKNPSRFSRLPGHIRLDTGKEQKLLQIKNRVPNEALEAWLTSRGVPKQDEAWEDVTYRAVFKDPNGLSKFTKLFLERSAPEGEWNVSLFKASADFCRCGYSEQEAAEELTKVTGILHYSDLKTISSAYKNETSK